MKYVIEAKTRDGEWLRADANEYSTETQALLAMVALDYLRLTMRVVEAEAAK